MRWKALVRSRVVKRLLEGDSLEVRDSLVVESVGISVNGVDSTIIVGQARLYGVSFGNNGTAEEHW
jgi:hypothetical protein